MPFLVEELPTFLMALGQLGIWRNDYAFGASFLTTRVAYHYVGSYVAFFLPCLATDWPFLMLTNFLHTYWGVLWIRGQLKREKRKGQVRGRAGPGDLIARGLYT